jgi:glycosyltransferase involved in cell wall biosynthesis
VRAVTTADAGGRADPGFPLFVARRDRNRLVRQSSTALTLLRAMRGAEVVYATGMIGRSVLTSTIHRNPIVLKLVSDPAYERARRLGLFNGTLAEFQQPQRARPLRALKRIRALVLSRASRVVIPSEYLAAIARGWGLPVERIRVIPNPAPPMDRSTPREELRHRLGVSSPTFVFAGRLVAQKNVSLAVSAIRDVADATLIVVGDGPLRSELERQIAESGVGDRVTLVGSLPRAQAIEWLRAADAAVLPSDWENFPHVAVEALAAGTPVLATSVGGVPEIIETGVNGILVPAGDVKALSAAMDTVARDSALLASLRDGALATGDAYSRDAVYAAIARELEIASR